MRRIRYRLTMLQISRCWKLGAIFFAVAMYLLLSREMRAPSTGPNLTNRNPANLPIEHSKDLQHHLNSPAIAQVDRLMTNPLQIMSRAKEVQKPAAFRRSRHATSTTVLVTTVTPRYRPLEKCWEAKEEQHNQATWDRICHHPGTIRSVCRVDGLDVFPKLTSIQTVKLESLGLQVVTFSSEDEVSKQLLAESDWGSESVDALLELLGGQKEPDRRHWLLDVGAGLGLFTLATVARGQSAVAVEASHHSLGRLAASLAAAASAASDAGKAVTASVRLYWNALPDATTPVASSVAVAQLAFRVAANACSGMARPRVLLPQPPQLLPYNSSTGGQATIGDGEEVDSVRVRVASLAEILAEKEWPAPKLIVKWDMSLVGLGGLLAARHVLAWPNVTSVLLLEVPLESAVDAAQLLAGLRFEPRKLQGQQLQLDRAAVESWPKDVVWTRGT